MTCPKCQFDDTNEILKEVLAYDGYSQRGLFNLYQCQNCKMVFAEEKSDENRCYDE